MRHLAIVIAMALPAVATAEGEWVPMHGAEIVSALTERALQYETARQTFYASGRTLYDSGRPSWGYWQVQDDRYCSMWPPSDLWACYALERRGEMLRFSVKATTSPRRFIRTEKAICP